MARGQSGNAVYEGSDLQALSGLHNYRAWILDHFRPYVAGDVIEVGAGNGAFSRALASMADALTVLEPSTALLPALAARFKGNPDVCVLGATLEDWLAQVAPRSADTVVMINVLEHIADDVAALTGLRQVLRSEGHLLIFVPALSWLYSEIDRLHGHFRRYHLGELSDRARGAGFEVVSVRYFDFLGILPWWLINTMAGATVFNRRAAIFYDRVGVPLTRAVEAVVAPPVGKNVIAVLKKRRAA